MSGGGWQMPKNESQGDERIKGSVLFLPCVSLEIGMTSASLDLVKTLNFVDASLTITAGKKETAYIIHPKRLHIQYSILV